MHVPFPPPPALTVGPHTLGGPDLVCILGPCVLESEDGASRIAEGIATVCARLGVPWIFKASFDKANRSSASSFRGPGLDEGLAQLGRIGRRVGVPLTTDVHLPEQAAAAAEVVDLLQVPAFLCRQTDLLEACGATGRPVNVKKGQFVAPADMAGVVGKLPAGRVMLTERGASFGYNNLVVDYRSLPTMRALGVPVCFDATHSVQLPGGGATTGGDRRWVPYLARAAAAVGIDALFMEVHDRPEDALSDGPNMVRLSDLEALLRSVLAVRAALAV
jgi:2-dehydro-3-deoxyphosphooctonate aldolase (KDO 8-P synthase)